MGIGDKVKTALESQLEKQMKKMQDKLAGKLGKENSYQDIQKSVDLTEKIMGKVLDAACSKANKIRHIDIKSKEGQIEIFYKNGGIILIDKKGTLHIDLDKAHGTKTVHMDKKGIHIVCKAGGGSDFDITTEDVQVKIDKESVSVKAKQKIELQSTDADIKLHAPKGKIILDSKIIETKSEQNTKMEVKRNFEVKVEKDIKITSTGSTEIEATKDLNLRTRASMEIKATNKLATMAKNMDGNFTSSKVKAKNMGLEASGPLTQKGSIIRLN